jgi:DNA-binding PadR family transcriptional regulator
MSPMVSRPLTMEYALLGFLQFGPLHGYQLHQQLCEPAGLRQVWYLKQAQLYALLSKLEEAGYITGSIQQQESRPARRVFQLTDTGKEVLHNWLFSAVLQPRQMRQEFQAKLYFVQLQGSEACNRLITVQRQTCQQWLEAHQKSTEMKISGSTFTRLVDQYRAGQIQAMLDWLDFCQSTLQAEK